MNRIAPLKFHFNLGVFLPEIYFFILPLNVYFGISMYHVPLVLFIKIYKLVFLMLSIGDDLKLVFCNVSI
jgi:hypothetical protein